MSVVAICKVSDLLSQFLRYKCAFLRYKNVKFKCLQTFLEIFEIKLIMTFRRSSIGLEVIAVVMQGVDYRQNRTMHSVQESR